MLSIILIVLIVCWLLGFSFSLGGSLIHLLLVIAVIIFIYDLITKRRS